jgi:hypothetical protein
VLRMYCKDHEMEINRNNYETFFLLYLDRELNPSEMQEVEKFVGANADLEKEFTQLRQTIFIPAETIFAQKDLLLRREEKRRIVPFYRMRVAAAVTFLILGSWFTATQMIKNHTGKMAGGAPSAEGRKNSAQVLDANAKSGNEKKTADEINTNSADLSKRETKNNQPAVQENLTAAQYKSPEKKETVHSVTKDPNNLPGKKEQVVQPDHLHPDPQSQASDESLIAVQKSSALELQTSESKSGTSLSQISTVNHQPSTANLIAVAGETNQIRYENAVLTESDYQTDNAISVVALNDQNKGISKFFKKITKQTPSEDNGRKVRVSVFQFSY